MERKQVTVGSKPSFLVVVLCALTALAAGGCYHRVPVSAEINQKIDVFGVELFATTDYREIKGVTPEKESCIKGYEYIFDPLDVAIGYTTKGSIRKITTRNRQTSIFNIRVGDSFAQGRQKLNEAGFLPGDTPYRFVKGWCSLSLLVDEKENIFGITVEVLD